MGRGLTGRKQGQACVPMCASTYGLPLASKPPLLSPHLLPTGVCGTTSHTLPCAAPSCTFLPSSLSHPVFPLCPAPKTLTLPCTLIQQVCSP